MILAIVLFALFTVVCIYLFYYMRTPVRSSKVKYFRVGDDLDYNKSTSLPLAPVMTDISNDCNAFLVESGYPDSQFLLFETLNNIDQNVQKIPLNTNLQYVYGINGSDLFCSKNMLASIIKASGFPEILPQTYLTFDANDMNRFKEEFEFGSAYIMKKNIQRQEGVKIFISYPEIIKVAGDYVVIQKLLRDPFLVGGRKINMRVYMLVFIERGKCKMYIYKDGFMYYTPKLWSADSISPDTNITTGYIDRQVYVDNPLTIQDFGVHIGQEKFKLFWKNLTSTMSKVKKAYAHRLAQLNIGGKERRFLVYGVDIAPDSNLGCKIMEINKGPDLSYKDERDKQVKYNMMKHAFDIVQMLPCVSDGDTKTTGFVQI